MITFKQTCDKPYDRHKYKLHLSNNQIEHFEWYDELLVRWFQLPYQLRGYVEVVDRKRGKVH